MKKKLQVTQYVSKYFPPIVNAQTVDFSTFGQRLEAVKHSMRTQGQWFEDGHNYDFRQATTKDIVLGRYQFYVQFADFLYEKRRRRSYLLDYMTRLEDGQESLLFYINSAERIDINLEGVKPRELWQATIGLGRLARKRGDIKAPFTTAWEINQVFYLGILDRAWFHTGRSMRRWQAYLSMGLHVPLGRILDDNKDLLAAYELGDEPVEELQSLDSG